MPSPSFFHNQSITIFPKSVSTLSLSPVKPLPPTTQITNSIVRNNSTLFAPR